MNVLNIIKIELDKNKFVCHFIAFSNPSHTSPIKTDEGQKHEISLMPIFFFLDWQFKPSESESWARICCSLDSKRNGCPQSKKPTTTLKSFNRLLISIFQLEFLGSEEVSTSPKWELKMRPLKWTEEVRTIIAFQKVLFQKFRALKNWCSLKIVRALKLTNF